MMRQTLTAAAIAVCLLAAATGQTPAFTATSIPTETVQLPDPSERAAINTTGDPILRPFRFRSIGPASMGGRIDDIAVSDSDPNIIYIGYAVGGVFKSENKGTTFEPVFEEYTTASIGDIAIHPTNPDIVYVGTGEPNNRQTSSFGDGIYRTSDGGRTFRHMGLRETQTIARIVIDPRSPDTLYVAAPGHLFGPNKERGIYKSTDGGQSWTHVKFVDEDTGFTDLVLDPADPGTLYAASYQRRRTGCCFNGGGPGSALWKSTDAGNSWVKLTGNGLPPGTYGRIGLDVSQSNPNVVYALIEAGSLGQRQLTEETDSAGDAEPPVRSTPGVIEGTAARQPRTDEVPGQTGRAGAASGAYNWCNNAGPGRGGRGRGTTPVTPPPLDASRGGLFRSEDKGATWTHVSNCNPRPVYFSKVRVDPTNDGTVYILGLPLYKSLDGGRTFVSLDEAGGHQPPAHVDQHALWIDPRNPTHMLLGNDGGFNITWDQGRTWEFVNTMATSLAYWVSADLRRPYYVYVGLQDNGSWGGPSATRTDDGVQNSDWFRIGSGDGFQTAVDPTDYNIVYTESQNGNTNRYDLRTGTVQSIRPRASVPGRGAAGRGQAVRGRTPFGGNVLNAHPEDQYRFNWNTPFQLSPHNPSVIWLGGNRLFKSYNRGDTWLASEDLTKRVDRTTISIMGVPGRQPMLSKNDGVAAYSTIVSIDESPLMPGVVWVGTDDGYVQVSRDGGVTFTEVGRNLPGLPADHLYWISRIEASHFEAATAYVAVDGHRSNDLKPYLFVTRDYGRSWQNISGNLPAFGFIQVVREDTRNRDLLVVGTEFGLYISVDRGGTWKKFMNNLPTARVDDLLIHPRDSDLIVATHARGVWIADDISPLQQLTPDVQSQDLYLFEMRPAVAWVTDRRRTQYLGGQKRFTGENPPRAAMISYFLKAAAETEVRIAIADGTGRTIRTLPGTPHAGINRVLWDLTAGPQNGRGRGAAVSAGTYVVTLEAGGRKLVQPLTVLEDVWMRD